MELVVPIISALIAFGSLTVAVLTLLSNRKKDNETQGELKGSMASDLGYIKAGVDDMKRESRELRGSMEKIREELAANKESTKMAHKRIDQLSKYHEPHHHEGEP